MCDFTRAQAQAYGNSEIHRSPYARRGDRNAVIVAFGLDYTVNCGLREADGIGKEFCHETIAELMKIRRNKRTFFQRGLRAMSLILSSF